MAKGYASASTKTTCLINGCLAPHFKAALVNAMQAQPFSIAIDGSNDTGIEKMNPLTVRLYDTSEGCIVTRFLDMCLTKGLYTIIYINRMFFSSCEDLLNNFDSACKCDSPLIYRHSVCNCWVHFWEDGLSFPRKSDFVDQLCGGFSRQHVSKHGQAKLHYDKGITKKPRTILHGVSLSYYAQYLH